MDGVNKLLGNLTTEIINPLVLLLAAVAFIVFVYGVWEYYFKDSEGAERSKGGKHILWGLVGFFIMISAFGIIRIILNTFGGSQSANEFNVQYQQRDTSKIDAIIKNGSFK
jgi:uncharacterized membrane protein (DUF373 family)